MATLTNSIRKVLFTNYFSENLILQMLRVKNNSPVRKLIAPNDIYPKNTIRKVKRFDINFQLDLNDYQEWLIYFNSDAEDTFNVLNFLSDAKTIFDVGGNIGQTALAMSKKLSGSDAKFFSFEPYPVTFEKFKSNLALNPDFKNITVENIALGDKESELQMFRDCETNSGGFRVVYDEGQNVSGLTKIKATTLDKYAGDNNISKVDFIKIDVEGFEMAVLHGAEKTLRKDKPSLFIELDDANLKKQNASAKMLVEFLAALGYKIKNAATGEVLSASSDFQKHFDIFCSI